MRYKTGGFVLARQEDEEDTRVFDYGRYPPIAILTHASSLDSRHALTDRAVWGFVMIKSLSEALIGRVKNAAGMAPESWARARDLIVNAPDRLTVTLAGNHLFFVGEAGARRTAETLTSLRAEASQSAIDLKYVNTQLLHFRLLRLIRRVP